MGFYQPCPIRILAKLFLPKRPGRRVQSFVRPGCFIQVKRKAQDIVSQRLIPQNKVDSGFGKKLRLAFPFDTPIGILKPQKLGEVGFTDARTPVNIVMFAKVVPTGQHPVIGVSNHGKSKSVGKLLGDYRLVGTPMANSTKHGQKQFHRIRGCPWDRQINKGRGNNHKSLTEDQDWQTKHPRRSPPRPATFRAKNPATPQHWNIRSPGTSPRC